MNPSLVSPEKQGLTGFSPEMLAQVSSYLNLPSSIASSEQESGTGLQAEILPMGEDSASVASSFLTAALTGSTGSVLDTEASGVEGICFGYYTCTYMYMDTLYVFVQ